MYRSKSIAVVIPVYNEEKLIADTLRSIPNYVDHVIVINDASTDSTNDILKDIKSKISNINVVNHDLNKGVGGAIGTGYAWCKKNGIDVSIVVAGDNQMDSSEMYKLIDPIVDNLADYVKGERLSFPEAKKIIPKVKYIGILVLTFVTRMITGYWKLKDSQCGYTAISNKALAEIQLDQLYPRYGIPNDLLVTLSIHRMRVEDVPVRPIYNIGEVSGICIKRDIFLISKLLLKLILKKLKNKFTNE